MLPYDQNRENFCSWLCKRTNIVSVNIIVKISVLQNVLIVHIFIENIVVKMDEISEQEELSLYTEFLRVASELVAAEYPSDTEEFLNESDEDQTMDDEEEIGGDREEDKDDEDTCIHIMQCIINLIELEYILQAGNPKIRRKGERRWGVHPLNQMRREQGHFDNLFKEMLAHDHEKFFNFTRMTPERFQHLFELIETKITKTSPNAIPAKCRLLLTLRYIDHF